MFFVLSKIAFFCMRAETWIVAGLVFSLIALACSSLRWARVFVSLTLVLAFTTTFLPLGELMMRPLEMTYPVNPKLEKVDGIIILGGSEEEDRGQVWKQVEFNSWGERFYFGLELARQFPTAKLVFSGGVSNFLHPQDSALPEKSVAERALASTGIDPERCFIEGRSRNTAENAANSFALLKPTPDEHWVLVTSAFHMRRAMRSFKRAGWQNITAYPVDHQTSTLRNDLRWNMSRHIDILDIALKEYVGLVVYGLTGR